MEGELHRVLFRGLAARGTPAQALLGAKLTAEGGVDPAVHLQDAALGERRLSRLPPEPLAAELLPALVAELKLDLVADYHTRSTRLTLSKPSYTLREVLTLAAERYELVFRVEDGALLARNRYWPDRDEEETPAPYPERWVRLKQQDRSLSAADLTRLGTLSDARLDGLSAYRDGKVEFGLEVFAARKHRWFWGLMATLTPAQRATARSQPGLAIRSLDLRQRNFIAQSVGTPAHWERVRLSVEETQAAPGRPAFVQVQLKDPGAPTPILHVFLPGPG